MLCADCEERFAQVEAATAARIFMPLHEQGTETFRYGSSFVQFAVSVLWRTLIFMRVARVAIATGSVAGSCGGVE